MGYLPDHELERLIRGGELVTAPDDYPFDWEYQLQPASFDLRLDNLFTPVNDDLCLDTLITDTDEHDLAAFESQTFEKYVLGPGECLLAQTVETVHASPRLAIQVDGRSSWGRRFLSVHITAGYVDPGFSGRITLEIVNHRKRPILLRPGCRICQLRVAPIVMLDGTPTSVRDAYGSRKSHYQNQSYPRPAAADFLSESE